MAESPPGLLTVRPIRRWCAEERLEILAMAGVEQRSVSIEEIVGALHAVRAALEQENWVTLTGQEDTSMATIPQAEDQAARTASDEPITGSPANGPAFRPISNETRRRAAEAIHRLRTLQEAILADRGGKPFTEDELTAALHEARAAHERGE
jgi:hypothetical protein